MKSSYCIVSMLCILCFILGIFSSCDSNDTEEHCSHENTTVTKEQFYHCSKEGYTAEITCDDCHRVIQEQVPCPPTGHDNFSGLCWMCNEYYNCWEVKYVLDEFGDPTDEYYIQNIDPIYTEYFDFDTNKNECIPVDILVNKEKIIISTPETSSSFNAKANLTIRIPNYDEDIYLTDVGKFDTRSGDITILYTDDNVCAGEFGLYHPFTCVLKALMSGEVIKIHTVVYTTGYLYQENDFLLTIPTQGFAEKYNEVYS